jgi:nitrile hydratase accessory protein
LARDREPAFTEPWQAQALALADQFVARGLISADDWSQCLGAEIRKAAAKGAADNLEAYYLCVVAALESLSVTRDLLKDRELKARKDAWIEAFQSTPHGKPVKLPKG